MSLPHKLAALLIAASLSMTGAVPAFAQSSQTIVGPGGQRNCDWIADREERRRCRQGPANNNDDIGAAIGIGIVGIAIGAMIAGAAAQEQAKKDRQYERWLAYCSQKYRSFDPRTGTYIDRNGRERACR